MTTNEKFVVLSSDDNPDYAFYAPLTCAAWMKHGYRPILLLVGTSAHWAATPRHQLVVAAARKYGAHIVFVGEHLDHASATVAQLSRIYACAVPGLDSDATLMTSDVDMWPAGPWVGAPQDGGRLHLYNGAAYGVQEHSQFPICYVDANAATWREIVGGGTVDECLRRGLGALDEARLSWAPGREMKERIWDWDERYLGRLISTWPEFKAGARVIPRHMGVYGQKRLDRSYWHSPPSLDGYADVHLPRPGFVVAHWWSVRQVFERLVGEQAGREADDFRTKWLEVM